MGCFFLKALKDEKETAFPDCKVLYIQNGTLQNFLGALEVLSDVFQNNLFP